MARRLITRRLAQRWRRDLAWLGVGVGVGILVAPRRGSDLRNRIGTRVLHWSKVGTRTVLGRSKDIKNRAMGLVAETRHLLTPEKEVDPSVLLDRVHSHLGHASELPLSHINLTAVGRVIVVHGFVPSDADAERLAQAIREVDGVIDVSLEHLHIQPAA